LKHATRIFVKTQRLKLVTIFFKRPKFEGVFKGTKNESWYI